MESLTYEQVLRRHVEEIQRLLDRGIHRYAIAREYRCTNVAINKYIKNHNLIEPVIEKITFKK